MNLVHLLLLVGSAFVVVVSSAIPIQPLIEISTEPSPMPTVEPFLLPLPLPFLYQSPEPTSTSIPTSIQPLNTPEASVPIPTPEEVNIDAQATPDVTLRSPIAVEIKTPSPVSASMTNKSNSRNTASVRNRFIVGASIGIGAVGAVVLGAFVLRV